MPLTKQQKAQKKRAAKQKNRMQKKVKTASAPETVTLRLPTVCASNMLIAVRSHMCAMQEMAEQAINSEIGLVHEDKAELGFQYVCMQSILRQLIPPADAVFRELCSQCDGPCHCEHETDDPIKEAIELVNDFKGAILQCVNAMAGGEGVKTPEGWQWKVRDNE